MYEYNLNNFKVTINVPMLSSTKLDTSDVHITRNDTKKTTLLITDNRVLPNRYIGTYYIL